MTRILVVEGDDAQAAAIEDSLRVRDDWQIQHVRTLMEAIRAAGEDAFDAAVLDTELPDGSGLDILDFLRIGSPGIRIVLVSGAPSESAAFHALSHGAGDYLVLDKHLDQELPRRLDALLDAATPEVALIETLRPSLAPARAARAEPATPQPAAPAQEARALDAALRKLVDAGLHAVGVYDLRGRPVATHAGDELDSDADLDGMGFAAAALHNQLGGLYTYGGLKPTGYEMLVEVEVGLLGLTAVPGTYILAALFDERIERHQAIENLHGCARRVLEALYKDRILD